MKEALYRKIYKIRSVSEKTPTIEVTLPRLVIEREARKHNLTIEEFLDQFVAIAQFNNIEGVLYTFEKKNSSKE